MASDPADALSQLAGASENPPTRDSTARGEEPGSKSSHSDAARRTSRRTEAKPTRSAESDERESGESEPVESVSSATAGLAAAGGGGAQASRSPGPRGGGSRRRPAKSSESLLKKVGVLLLIVVGLLLLVPFVWSVGMLTGRTSSDREGAEVMAKVMLICGPLALTLFAGAGFFVWQIMRSGKRSASSARRGARR